MFFLCGGWDRGWGDGMTEISVCKLDQLGQTVRASIYPRFLTFKVRWNLRNFRTRHCPQTGLIERRNERVVWGGGGLRSTDEAEIREGQLFIIYGSHQTVERREGKYHDTVGTLFTVGDPFWRYSMRVCFNWHFFSKNRGMPQDRWYRWGGGGGDNH